MAELVAQLCQSRTPILEQLKLDPPDSAFSAADHGDETRQRISSVDDDVYLYSYWIKGKRNGRAFVKDSDDNTLINMRFVDGLLEGTMILTDYTSQLFISYSRNSPTGKVKVVKDAEVEFEGEFKYGKANGSCVQYFSSGRRFRGSYRYGLASGEGSLLSENGSTLLSGEWKNGQLDSISVCYPRLIAFIWSFSPVPTIQTPIVQSLKACLNASGIHRLYDFYKYRTDSLIFKEEQKVFVVTEEQIQEDKDRKRRMEKFTSWQSSMEAYVTVRDEAFRKYSAIRKRIEQKEREERESQMRLQLAMKAKEAEEARKRAEEAERKKKENELIAARKNVPVSTVKPVVKPVVKPEVKPVPIPAVKPVSKAAKKRAKKRAKANAAAAEKPVANPTAPKQTPKPTTPKPAIVAKPTEDSSDSDTSAEESIEPQSSRQRGKLAEEMDRQIVRFDSSDDDIAGLDSYNE